MYIIAGSAGENVWLNDFYYLNLGEERQGRIQDCRKGGVVN